MKKGTKKIMFGTLCLACSAGSFLFGNPVIGLSSALTGIDVFYEGFKDNYPTKYNNNYYPETDEPEFDSYLSKNKKEEIDNLLI